MMEDKITEFSYKLGYHFEDEGLLCEGLTHSSYRRSGKSDYDNERYEFLGDRVLNLIIAEWLMENHPEQDEGKLTLLMSKSHDTNSLSEIAYELELQKYLYIDLGRIGRTFKKQRDSILADALEAVLGVVFMDGGYSAAQTVVLKLWKERLLSLNLNKLKASKALLQEHAQKHDLAIPGYTLLNQEGPIHDSTFTTEVFVDQLGKAQGVGSSKKKSEESAAKSLLEKIDIESNKDIVNS